jgi:N-acetylglutamate synthase-like GNAT family acetyltransferase
MLNERRLVMGSKTFLRAEEVAAELGVSKAYAYKLIRTLNRDLQKRGFITINGRISKQYFNEKVYDNRIGNEKGERNVSV